MSKHRPERTASQPPSRLEVDGVLYTELGGRVSVVGLSTGQTEVRIPENIHNAPVVDVENGAFAGCDILESITLPSSVTRVGAKAFEDCASLESVELPQSLEQIALGTFEGCIALQEVVLPYHLKVIGPSAFADCVSLQRIGYFSKRGIGTGLFTDRTLFQEALPEELTEIGEGAFEGCRSLLRVAIPHRVESVAPMTFAHCHHLADVGFHANMRMIGTAAFAGCTALGSVRIPPTCSDIAVDAFPPGTVLVVNPMSRAWRSEVCQGDAVTVRLAADPPRLRSGLGDSEGRFYSDEQLEAAKESMELRPLRFERRSRQAPSPAAAEPSRFVRSGDTYKAKTSHGTSTVRLMMVGDVMAGSRRQNLAQERGHRVFDEAFEYVTPLLEESDFAICNLETMMSPSAPYAQEENHIASRPHLNAPPYIATALRRAGFDAVVNAQNHVYDAGLEGMFETLDVLNQAQLIHTGLFASTQDDRYLLLDIAGIQVGVVSFMDRARQAMKRTTFTPEGVRTLLPFLTEDEVWMGVHAVKSAGAEFVIAYCHWGREYTSEITARQWGFGAMVAEAGADYIVGAHPHCLQPFEFIRTADGREVPCLWSAGNFVSEMNVRAPITRDSLLLDLELQRVRGEVVIVANSYHACRIMRLKVRDKGHAGARNYFTVPTSTRFKSARLNRLLHEAENRIERVVGRKLPMATAT